MDALRVEAAHLPEIAPEVAEPQRPAGKIADRIDRALARRAATAEDRYGFTLRYLNTAQRAATVAATLNRSGCTPGTKATRPMMARPALPTSGPASAVVSRTVTVSEDGTTVTITPATVEGFTLDEAAAALGIPDATPEQVTAAALGTLLRSANDDRPTIGGTLLPLAEWRKARRLEDVEDKRRHEAAQPVKKPNPRKRPRSGKLGTSATIR
jgi:hypothetical protein